ncbi:MASE3 domain-containing sensor histidine kinase [Clostridium cylindrosporum]|uniref:histidine kinase n=1 Tax=Clostridium cylindrosporum DSM 605 TaxID=1121307 RepID=A0A0J8DCH3_CLOCY|nr:MASE3 domain-containing protein [Clostridium cylindrosporum]KMT21953.1 sensor histidine kinase ResE [Clostridium cylindrosporum DSM 605]
MENNSINKKILGMSYGVYLSALIYILFFTGAIYMGIRDFLIFHTMVELFGIVIGFVMAIIAINTYKLNKDNRIVFLGVVFGFIAFINLIHLFAYRGMNISEVFTFNISIQVWTIGRYLQGIAFLVLFTSREGNYNIKNISITCLIVVGLLLGSVFYIKVFPQLYIKGTGFTLVKIIAGYLNCGILLGLLILLRKRNPNGLNKNDKALSLSILSNLVCEMFFVASSITYDIYSVFGHVFQIVSFYYIYIAVVRSSLQEPHYSLIELNSVLVNKNENLKALIRKLELEYQQRKELEDEKERKQQILNGILESSVDGMIVIDDDDKVIHFNNQFIRMLNIPFEITSKTTNSEIIEFVKKQIKNPEEFEGHVRKEWETYDEYLQYIYLKDGKIFETSSVPFIDSNTIKGRLIICRDITEKRKIEELKKQIEIRQASLEKAREFDELKTNFFCTVSHELKTPINIILGVIQLVSRTKESDLEYIKKFLSNKYINMMKQNCFRLIKLSNNLIDITKIDAGYTEMKIKNHDIISVIEDIILSVAEYTRIKGINLTFDTDIEEKIVACDAEQLERVMLNLLSNAIKYTESNGEIEVNIKDKEDSVVISVKDSGIGIPNDKLSLVFERFRQVDSTLTRQKEGSGIGLALVKSIVEKHGGKVSLKSEIGKGSEFIVELPANLVMDEDAINEVAATKDMNVDRINIEFSDIYELNIY